MKKRKIKKKIKIYILIIILLIILLIGTIYAIKEYNYRKTYEYKLINISYTIKEAKILEKYLNNTELDKILTIEYNNIIPKLVKEKYFLFKNLDRYINYQKENNNKEIKDIISLVNVNRDKEYYKDITETDVSKESAMLVNKYYSVNKDYEAKDIVEANSTYSYANNRLNKEAYEAFVKLADDAKKEGYTILILSSYRTYEYQDSLWKSRKDSYGTTRADQYAARAGSSEHETGYAIDVADYYDTNDVFGETKAYEWMINNCYKYGYILRYPKEKEELTGYSYEAWHYRYVGVEIATKIHEEDITFDEYYEYYLND